MTASDVVARYGWLSVKGAHLCDQYGHPAMLRGVSLFWSQWRPRFFDARTLRWLRDDWRVDVVRAPLGVHPEGYLANPGREAARVISVIEAAIELGVYVIVDWHAHEPYTPLALDFFGRLAARYANYPNLIYETWNEPRAGSDWVATVKPHHDAVIGRIRALAPRALVIAGTPTWSQDVEVALSDPLSEANVLYALHFYAGTHGARLRARAARARAHGAALFASEWGASECTGDGELNLAEARRWLAFLEANTISHVSWSIADKAEASAALKPDAALSGWCDGALTPSGRFVRQHLRDASVPQL